MNRHFMILTLSVSALSLAACASMPIRPEMNPAVLQEEPSRPVQIVEVPKILPLPGQLQPKPEKTQRKAAKEKLPAERVNEANKAATQEPTEYGYVNALQVYPFAEGALYQLYAAPERVSDIMLQPGEKLMSVSSGDTVRWTLGDTLSGTGDDRQVHILLKPFASDLKTNMVIATDRRTYHLQLKSTEETYMAGLFWSYPKDQLAALQNQNAWAQAAQPLGMDIALENIDFNYEISGDKPSWRPLRAFDDERKVYIEFPEGIQRDEAPPLFVVGRKGDADLVNYRMRGNYYIVDRLFSVAELRLGENPQAVVRITKTEHRGVR